MTNERTERAHWCGNHLILYFTDRPWLTDSQKVQKLQEKLYVALQHCLHKSGAPEENLAKVTFKSPKNNLLHLKLVHVMEKAICLFCWLYRWCPDCPWWSRFATFTLINWSFSVSFIQKRPTVFLLSTERFSAARSPFQTPLRANIHWSAILVLMRER